MNFDTEMSMLAEAIRDKANVDYKMNVTEMRNAVRNINVGGNIDFSGVNVTADTLLAGAVAIGNGGQRIEGAIETSDVIIEENTFRASKGYIENDIEESIQIVNISFDDEVGKVHIDEGYVYKDDLYLGSLMVDTFSNVVQISQGYNTTLQEITIAEATITDDSLGFDVTEGYLKDPIHFDLINDNNINVNDNVVTIPSGILKSNKVVTIPEASVNETTEEVVISKGYLKNPLQYQLNAGGGGGSSAGSFDLWRVESYKEYKPEATYVIGVNVEGIGYYGSPEDPDWYEDYSDANGWYYITPETAEETDYRLRTYKHESGNYVLFYYISEDYPEECRWCFKQTGESWEFCSIYNTNEDGDYVEAPDLSTGDYEAGNWEEEPWSIHLNVNTETTPEQQFELRCRKVSEYNNGWVLGGQYQNFNGFDITPTVGKIYTSNNERLIGMPVTVDALLKTPKNMALYFRPDFRMEDYKWFKDVTGKCKVMKPQSQLNWNTDYKKVRCFLPTFKSNYVGYIGEGGIMIRNLPVLNAFTIEYWCYFDSTDNNRIGDIVIAYELGYEEDMQKIVKSLGTQGNVPQIYKEWYHVAIIHEAGADHTKEFINGVYHGNSEFKGMPEMTYRPDWGDYEFTGEYSGKLGGNGDNALQFTPGFKFEEGPEKYFDEFVIWDKVVYDVNGFTPPAKDKPYCESF